MQQEGKLEFVCFGVFCCFGFLLIYWLETECPSSLMLASENQGDRGCQSQVGVAPELLRAAQSSLTTVFRRCALNICRDSPLNIALRHTCITQGTNWPLGAWGVKRTEILVWGGYSITARFAVSCTLLLKHLVLVTVGHRTLEELGPGIAPAMLFQ